MEALVGVQFTALLAAVALSGGATLPQRPIDQYAGVVWIIWYAMQPELLRIYAWQAAILYLANVVTLIDEDRQTLPRRIAWIVFWTGLFCLVLYPDLHPLLNINLLPDQQFTLWQRWQGVISGALGLAVGAVIGAATSIAARGDDHRRILFPSMVLYGVAGLGMGWQAAISMGLIASLMALLLRVCFGGWIYFRHRSILDKDWLASCVQVFAWGWLDGHPWWPGSRAPWYVFVLSVLWILIAHAFVGAAAPQPDSAGSEAESVTESSDDEPAATRPVAEAELGSESGGPSAPSSTPVKPPLE